MGDATFNVGSVRKADLPDHIKKALQKDTRKGIFSKGEKDKERTSIFGQSSSSSSNSNNNNNNNSHSKDGDPSLQKIVHLRDLEKEVLALRTELGLPLFGEPEFRKLNESMQELKQQNKLLQDQLANSTSGSNNNSNNYSSSGGKEVAEIQRKVDQLTRQLESEKQRADDLEQQLIEYDDAKAKLTEELDSLKLEKDDLQAEFVTTLREVDTKQKELRDLNAENDSLKTKLEMMNKQLAHSVTRVSTAESRVLELQALLNSKDSGASAQQRALADVEAHLADSVAQHALFKKKIEDLEKDLVAERTKYESEKRELSEQSQRELQTLRSTIDSLTAELSEKSGLVAAAEKRVQAQAEQNATNNAKITQKLEDALKESQASMADALSRCSDLEARLIESETQRRQLAAKVEQMTRNQDSAIADLEAQVRSLTSDLQSLRTEHAHLQQSQSRHVESLTAAESQRDTLTARVQAIQAELDLAHAKKQEFEQRAESAEAQFVELEEKWKTGQSQIANLERELASQKSSLELEHSQAASLQERINAANTKLSQYATQVADLESMLARMDSQLQQSRADLDAAVNERKQAEETVKSSREQSNQAVAALKQQIEALNAKCEKAASAFADLEVEHHSLQERFQFCEKRSADLALERDRLIEERDARTAHLMDESSKNAATAADRVAALEAIKQSLESDLKSATSHKAHLETERSRLDKELEDTRRLLQQERTQASERTTGMQSDIARLEAALSTEKQAVQDRTAACERMERELQRTNEDLEKIHTEGSELQRRIAEMVAAHDAVQQELTQARSELETIKRDAATKEQAAIAREKQLQAELESARKTAQDLKREQSQTASEVTTKLQASEKSVAELRRERDELVHQHEEKLRQLKSAAEDRERQLKDELERSRATLNDENTRWRANLEQLQQKLNEADQARTAVDAELAACKAKLLSETERLNTALQSERTKITQMELSHTKSIEQVKSDMEAAESAKLAKAESLAQSKVAQIQSERDKLQRDIEALTHKRTALERDLLASQESLKSTIAEYEQKLAKEKADGAKALRDTKLAMQNDIEQARLERSTVDDASRAQIQKLQDSLLELQTANTNLEAQLRNSKAAETSLNQKIQALEVEKTEFLINSKQTSQSVQQIQEEKERLSKEIRSVQNAADERLKAVVAEYNEGVAAIETLFDNEMLRAEKELQDLRQRLAQLQDTLNHSTLKEAAPKELARWANEWRSRWKDEWLRERSVFDRVCAELFETRYQLIQQKQRPSASA